MTTKSAAAAVAEFSKAFGEGLRKCAEAHRAKSEPTVAPKSEPVSVSVGAPS